MNNICVKNTKLIMVIFISSFSTIQVFRQKIVYKEAVLIALKV